MVDSGERRVLEEARENKVKREEELVCVQPLVTTKTQ